MALLQRFVTWVRGLVASPARSREDQASLRRDLPECCRDEEARRYAIETMRQDYWRG